MRKKERTMNGWKDEKEKELHPKRIKEGTEALFWVESVAVRGGRKLSHMDDHW